MSSVRGLRVVLLAPAGSVHTRRWAAALAGAGHRVVVASWRPGHAGPVIGAPVDVRVAAASRRLTALRAPAAVLWLRRLIAEVRPDVVHVHSIGVHGLLSLALPHGPARVVTPWGSELRAARHSRVRAALARLALRRADLVMPTSAEAAREVARRAPAARITLLSWGVAAELIAARASICPGAARTALRIPSGASVVLSVRSCAASYRTWEIVSAFTRAAADRDDLFLVLLAGHRPERASPRRAADGYLRRIAAACARTKRILIVDRPLSSRQTFELMCASDAAVSVPTGDQRSSSVLEAALAGCHLLLSDIAPYRELVGDGLVADLMAEPIVASLAARLRQASRDPASQHANREFVLAREHGADKLAELELIYRKLSNRCPLQNGTAQKGRTNVRRPGQPVPHPVCVHRQPLPLRDRRTAHPPRARHPPGRRRGRVPCGERGDPRGRRVADASGYRAGPDERRGRRRRVRQPPAHCSGCRRRRPDTHRGT